MCQGVAYVDIFDKFKIKHVKDTRLYINAGLISNSFLKYNCYIFLFPLKKDAWLRCSVFYALLQNYRKIIRTLALKELHMYTNL